MLPTPALASLVPRHDRVASFFIDFAVKLVGPSSKVRQVFTRWRMIANVVASEFFAAAVNGRYCCDPLPNLVGSRVLHGVQSYPAVSALLLKL